MNSITLPNSVQSIGDSAFYNCSSLNSITLPEGITSIGGHAFSECSSLVSITLPDGVTSIGEYAFYNCSSLTTVYSKNPTPPIYSGGYSTPFYYCVNLEKIYVPTESVDAYKTAWSYEASIIEGYDFSN